jgi:hypothetical protein
MYVKIYRLACGFLFFMISISGDIWGIVLDDTFRGEMFGCELIVKEPPVSWGIKAMMGRVLSRYKCCGPGLIEPRSRARFLLHQGG